MTEREMWIVNQRNLGTSFSAIGDYCGISRQRVEQILKKVGYVGKPAFTYAKPDEEELARQAQKNRDNVKAWQKANPEGRRAQNRRYHAKRYSQDANFRLKKSLRNRYRLAILGSTNCTAESLRLLGCSIQEVRALLEKQFAEGMSWENYGEWELDHVRPCASFDFSDPKQIEQCFHFSNLQPLWAEENRLKSDKWEAVAS